MDPTIVTGEQWPDDLERLLRDLPEWFGIEQSILDYVDAARTLPTVAAMLDGNVVGVCVVRHHNAVAAEIEVLAVDRALHRHGIGRRVLDRVEADLRAGGVKIAPGQDTGSVGGVGGILTNARVLRVVGIPAARRTYRHLGSREPLPDPREATRLNRPSIRSGSQ